jgi:hypothetical protein
LAVTSLWAADVPVLTSPTSAVASNGYAFSYQITATGDPTGYDATGLPPGVSVNTTSGLISGSPNASGTFNVTVTATNTAGVGMGLLSLTVVYAPPVIVGQPQSLSLKSGEVAVYRVEASGQMTLSYRWTKGGAALQSTDRLSGIDGPQFSISPVLPQDAGTYEVVVAQAGLETAAQPVELLVDVVLPLVTNHPLSRSVASGDTVTFSGGASGDPTLVYRWQRDGADLDDGGRFTGTATPELTISNATAEETGWYALTVSNAGGRVASNPARLTVHTDSGYAQAVNFDEGVWTSGGDASWFVQSILTQDGLGAARSGAIGHGGTTFLETTVFGPGDLSFFWTASSEDCCDRLTLFVNGVPVDSIGGEVGWTERTLHLPWGAHTLRWQYRKDGSVEAGLDAACLDQVAFQPSRVTGLETALAAIPLPLTAGGNAPWFGQENVNADGASAGRSGYIGHGESSTVETVVSGPGVVSFDWQVSSEGCCDRLSFLVDGIVWDSIGGEVSWTNRTFHLPWGTHTLVWSYRKDGSVDAGLDAGWLDRVTYDPVGIFNLTEASDNASQPWTAGGNQPWFGQNETTHDGADALQSGPVTHGQDSLLDSAVTGPGTLTFFWKVSSEYADPLVYSLDGLEQARIAGEVDWIGQTHIIRPGTHALRWQYHKDGSVNTGQDSGWLDQVAFVPAPTLPVALNNTQLLWSTSGDANWFSQLVTTHDGVAAARTDTLGDGQAAVLETSVMGPGELSFYWKVSSEAGFDILAILMDDAEQARISGEVDWTQRALTVPDGLHTLKWRYSKDGSRGSGADAAWLDEVVLNATSTVEVPLTNPAFLNGGTQFGLSVSTVGGWTYVLEYKNALGDSEWIPLPGVAGDGTVKALIDPAPPALHRFYRVRIISN